MSDVELTEEQIDAEIWGDNIPEEVEDVVEEVEEEVEEETEETEETEEVEEEVEEEEKDPLSEREQEVEDARKAFEEEERKRIADQQRAEVPKLEVKSIETLFEGLDVDSIEFPHPTEDGKTIGLEGMKEEYPDIVKMFEYGISATNQKHAAQIKSLEESFSDRLFEIALEAKHPDAAKIFEDPKFKEFMDKASPAAKAMVSKGTANDVSLVLDKFKKINAKPKAVPKAETKKPVIPKKKTLASARAKVMTEAEVDAELGW